MAFGDILNRIMFKLLTFSILQLENRFTSKDGMKILKAIMFFRFCYSDIKYMLSRTPNYCL